MQENSDFDYRNWYDSSFCSTVQSAP